MSLRRELRAAGGFAFGLVGLFLAYVHRGDLLVAPFAVLGVALLLGAALAIRERPRVASRAWRWSRRALTIVARRWPRSSSVVTPISRCGVGHPGATRESSARSTLSAFHRGVTPHTRDGLAAAAGTPLPGRGRGRGRRARRRRHPQTATSASRSPAAGRARGLRRPVLFDARRHPASARVRDLGVYGLAAAEPDDLPARRARPPRATSRRCARAASGRACASCSPTTPSCSARASRGCSRTPASTSSAQSGNAETCSGTSPCTSRTWRSSTSACRRRTRTRGCAPRRRSASGIPGTGVLVLSQYVEPGYAMELLSESAEGVGYLLKDRVADVDEFAAAVRRVAEGGSALDPAVVTQLVGRRRARRPAADADAARARGARADGGGPLEPGDRSASSSRSRAVEKHVTSIFAKLAPAGDGRRPPPRARRARACSRNRSPQLRQRVDSDEPAARARRRAADAPRTLRSRRSGSAHGNAA